MDFQQTREELESSKEVLLQIILQNKEDLGTKTIAEAIKEFVRNHEKYNSEKKKILEIISSVD